MLNTRATGGSSTADGDSSGRFGGAGTWEKRMACRLRDEPHWNVGSWEWAGRSEGAEPDWDWVYAWRSIVVGDGEFITSYVLVTAIDLILRYLRSGFM